MTIQVVINQLIDDLHEQNAFDAIDDIVDACHKNSVGHNFWDDQKMENGVLSPELVRLSVPEKIALIHSEASEALEDYRDKKMHTEPNREKNGKPEGFPSELADIVIRCFDLAGALKIDLGDEIRMKMRFNASREPKHGKVC
jgi:NTP pyrophosphatase (non-canonical NTP hydrolase)